LQVLDIFSAVALAITLSVASFFVKALNFEVLQVSNNLLPKS